MSSAGPYSSASGLPSPASVASGSTASPGGISTIIPLGNAFPLPTSPSMASSRRLSSNGPSLHATAGVRPSIDTSAERVGTPGMNQHPPRTFLNGSRDRQTAQGSVSGPFSDSRLARGRTSPVDQQRRSNRIPTLLQHNTSDTSSKSSIASTVSSASTAPSSLFSAGTVDEEKRATMSLPPLANITANTPGGSYLDSAAKGNHPPLTRRSAASFGPQRLADSPFNPSQTTGMKFESLQLPLPYNISFGQSPNHGPNRGKSSLTYSISKMYHGNGTRSGTLLSITRFLLPQRARVLFPLHGDLLTNLVYQIFPLCLVTIPKILHSVRTRIPFLFLLMRDDCLDVNTAYLRLNVIDDNSSMTGLDSRPSSHCGLFIRKLLSCLSS